MGKNIILKEKTIRIILHKLSKQQDYDQCKSTVESNIDLIDHTCKLERDPKQCAHYIFKKKLPPHNGQNTTNKN